MAPQRLDSCLLVAEMEMFTMVTIPVGGSLGFSPSICYPFTFSTEAANNMYSSFWSATVTIYHSKTEVTSEISRYRDKLCPFFSNSSSVKVENNFRVQNCLLHMKEKLAGPTFWKVKVHLTVWKRVLSTVRTDREEGTEIHSQARQKGGGRL